MAIADRINEMYTHVGDVYDTITNVDLPTNKNIQNIPSTMRSSYLEIMNNGIDKIWNNWEKVTGSGTDISLSPTLEAPMKNVLNGNTSQFTTTGKNLLKNTLLTTATTTTGVTATPNSDGSVTLNGTATAVTYFNLSQYDYGSTSFSSSYGGSTDYIASIGVTQTGVALGFNGSNKYTALSVNNGITVNNLKVYPMIRPYSVSDDTFEPFTNGASPNPDYPQEVHVVSGDNSINVCGKNICFTDFGDWESGEYNSSGNKGNNTSRVRTKDLLIVRQSTTYYFDTSSANDLFVVREYDKNKTFIKSDGIIVNGGTITTMSNCYFLGITLFSNTGQTRSYDTYQTLFEESTIKPFICLNSVSSKTYEPYQGNTYNIDLPVENLWHLDNATVNGVTLTNNADGSITLNGTCTSTSQFRTMFDTSLSNDTYTLGFVSSMALNTGSLFVRTRNSSGTLAQNIDVKVTSANQTITSDIKYLDLTIINGVTYNNVNLKIQLEKGSKANSYTPYGTTPIELCKIGNYQDYFYKDSGKWYLHKEIGKVVLDGSEYWEKQYGESLFDIQDFFLNSEFIVGYGLSDYYKYNPVQSGINANTSNGEFVLQKSYYDGTYKYNIFIKNIDFSNTNDFKNWLSTHNVVVYYVLATPVNTALEDM